MQFNGMDFRLDYTDISTRFQPKNLFGLNFLWLSIRGIPFENRLRSLGEVNTPGLWISLVERKRKEEIDPWAIS
jgi:hypothetical protein